MRRTWNSFAPAGMPVRMYRPQRSVSTAVGRPATVTAAVVIGSFVTASNIRPSRRPGFSSPRSRSSTSLVAPAINSTDVCSLDPSPDSAHTVACVASRGAQYVKPPSSPERLRTGLRTASAQRMRTAASLTRTIPVASSTAMRRPARSSHVWASWPASAPAPGRPQSTAITAEAMRVEGPEPASVRRFMPILLLLDLPVPGYQTLLADRRSQTIGARDGAARQLARA